MTRWVIVILLIAFASTAVWQGASAGAARTEMLRAQDRLAAVRADASEVLALRATPAPAIATGKRPEPGITGHISDTLIAAGLPVGDGPVRVRAGGGRNGQHRVPGGIRPQTRAVQRHVRGDRVQ